MDANRNHATDRSTPPRQNRKVLFLLLVAGLIVGVLLFLPERSAHQVTMPEDAVLPGGTRQAWEPFEPYNNETDRENQ